MARPTFLVAVADGDIKMGYSPHFLTMATNGENALVDTPAMAMVDGPGSPNDTGDAAIHRHMYFCDGTNYKRLDAHLGVVSTWTAFNGTDAVTGDTIAGELPKDDEDNVATIAATYRDRIVLAGVEKDPHNWFMSAVGDPRNWDYAPPTINATMAVAGSSTDAGRVADAVTALIAFGDDLLLFGCDKSLWMLRGDPADGGAIDALSRQVGVVGPDAWTWDPAGTLYFFGNDGLYRLVLGGAPERLSAGRIDRAFSQIDRVEHRILLTWDRQRKGLYIFVVSDDPERDAATSFWWDARTDSFWPFQLPAGNGPTSVAIWDSDAVQDREVLIGGRDGFIRKFQDRRPDDNNGATESEVGEGFDEPVDQAIQSHVEMGPISTEISRDLRLHDLNFTMSGTSFPVALSVRSGPTPEDAFRSDIVRFSKTLRRGANRVVRQRAGDNSVMVRLDQSALHTVWSIERADLVLRPAGRRRGGR
jgi:hypothetical protein